MHNIKTTIFSKREEKLLFFKEFIFYFILEKLIM